ncbi:peptidase inhibitor family I36 protein [Actinoplanes sp. CA-252034]|uniref:peptidase inhibitor family I36 protein n=1 Tax=Actinoplanes sp. CA-252034 TaxID=3239906 RepID=UPI003D99D74A
MSGGTMKAMRRLGTALIAVMSTVALIASPAEAGELSEAQIRAELGKQATTTAQLQRQIDLQLKLAPGGKQINANEVSYDNGKFVVTYASPNSVQAVRASADCPSDWFCFYAGQNFNYPRGKLRDCGWQDLWTWGWGDRTRSVDNGSASQIIFINHYDKGNPGNGHTFDAELFRLNNWSQKSTLAASADRAADHVNRILGGC